MLETEKQTELNTAADAGLKPVLDLSGMKNPERFKIVKTTLEALEFAGDVRLQLEQTMPQDLKRYSARNQMLIRLQRPEVQMVKGRKQWLNENRILKKGSKAIWILAPSKQRRKKTGNNDDEPEETLKGFFFIPIFDRNDTKPKD